MVIKVGMLFKAKKDHNIQVIVTKIDRGTTTVIWYHSTSRRKIGVHDNSMEYTDFVFERQM